MNVHAEWNKRAECRMPNISHFVESVNSKRHIVYYLWTHFVCATIINICIECHKEHQNSKGPTLKRQIIKRGWFWHCSLLLFISELIFSFFFCCCFCFVLYCRSFGVPSVCFIRHNIRCHLDDCFWYEIWFINIKRIFCIVI